VSHEWQRDGYTISTDRERLDLAAIHGYLSKSYWATGIPIELVKRSIEHAICFGIHHEDRQVGFARVITDRATFGYIGDVYVLEEHRGRGLSKWLMECIDAHPELQGFRRWVLVTRDAHGLYRQFGYAPLARPESYMERLVPDCYRAAAGELAPGSSPAPGLTPAPPPDRR